jgi:Cys-tRNA(Pro) deacylase
MDTPALAALAGADLVYDVVRYGRAESIDQAAELRGVEVPAVTKTLVVRLGADDFLLVLVSGDRVIDWAKLRAHLGVSRLSLADAAEAKAATGYERGTITPFGATRAWPVIADTVVADRNLVSIGGGAHGVAINVAGSALVTYLGCDVADVTKDGPP